MVKIAFKRFPKFDEPVYSKQELTKRQRFEFNLSQFPEYKQARKGGATHDEAINSVMKKRGIQAQKGKKWYEAKLPAFSLQSPKKYWK